MTGMLGLKMLRNFMPLQISFSFEYLSTIITGKWTTTSIGILLSFITKAVTMLGYNITVLEYI